jgi:Txe/YoeB family toxin of Txe-Axe toxin-antitoxin module
MRLIKKSKVVFADDKIEKDFFSLDEKDEIKKSIKKAIRDIEENAFCGLPIPKRVIPKEYIRKYKAKNLWKYDLPSGWRLIYTVTTPNKIEILSIILEWFNHPSYERRFHY